MDEPMAGTTLSGDEWEQAQYLPGASVATAPFGPDDPKKKKPAVPATTNLGRVLTGDEWEQAQTQSGPQVKALQIPRIPTLAKAPTDMTGTQGRVAGKSKGTPLAPFNIADPTTYANPVLRQIVNPALDNPIQTALTAPLIAGSFVGPAATPALAAAEAGGRRLATAVGVAMGGQMAHMMAVYGFQKAAEMQLSPEDRARAEADPERVSGEAAAVQAAMLGMGWGLHVGVKAMKGPSFGAGMLESGASGVHETMADHSVAAERTAPFQGELNAAHAASLEQGAASARGIRGESVPTTPPAGLETTAAGATLTRQPKPVEGLEAPETVTAGKVTPVGTEPASAPLEERAALDQSVRDYQDQTAEQDRAVLSAARQKAADAIAKADRFRPRRRGQPQNLFETEQGAQILGAAAARHAMPETANPYHPESPLATEWSQGHEAGLAASKNMAETGFASIPGDDPATVQLPQDGAGRAGSTVDAVAAAKRIVGPEKLRQLADAELARRGDPDIPEARMAAMEQVAREIASRQPTPEYPDGFSMGGGLTDNRIPGASEVPKVARGTDIPVPDGATPESVALANALKPSPFRGHSTDALAEAALDAQAALEHAQQAHIASQTADHGKWNDPEQTPESIFYEDRGIHARDEASASAEKAVTRAKSRLAQIEREFAMRGVSGDALADVIQGAKEQRAERAGMQSDDALAMHTGADDPFGEQPAPSGGLTPIEGTGDIKTRGVAASIARSVANKLGETLGDLPEYRQVDMKAQAARAADILTTDPALARQIALGEVAPPHGVLAEAVAIAVENKATLEGDVDTQRAIANGRLTSDATIMGQRNAAWAMRDPDSPVGAMQRVEDSRSGGVNVTRATAEQVEAIKKHLEAINVTDEALVKLIDSLRC